MVDMQHETRLQDTIDGRAGRVGRFELDGELGEGGMGIVYRSVHPTLERPVAIKVMRRPEGEDDPRARERFLREARCMAQVHHPSVARRYDLVEYDDCGMAMVLELVEGRTLHDDLLDGGAMDAERVAAVATELLDALQAAHAVGVIHRDIKPENVMVLDRPTAAGATLKLIDFGLAKPEGADDTQLTMAGHVLGTPQYMAPEQVQGEELDGRTDIYALGILMYELLAGERPFRHGQPMLLMIAQLQQTPAPLPVGVPAELEAVVRKALAKAPEDRYQTAAQMRQAIAAAMRKVRAARTATPSRRPHHANPDRPALSLVPRAHVEALAAHAAALN